MVNSDLPKTFTADYYDEKYFADEKTFRKADGTLGRWGYKNPEGEWTGASHVVYGWQVMFDPKNMLDVGSGRGTFVAYARNAGIEAVGFDYSPYAISHPYTKCKPGWLSLHDATKTWNYPSSHFDLVIATDLLEHIYEEDLTRVEEELFRVAKKWVFLEIATTRGGNNGLTEKYVKTHPELVLTHHRVSEAILKKDTTYRKDEDEPVAGHVTYQSEQYWLNRFAKYGAYRPDLVEYFCTLVDNKVIENWIQNSIIIMEVGA